MSIAALDPHVRDTVWNVIQSESYDPHSVLGLHPSPRGGKVIRIWHPEARCLHVEVEGKLLEATKVHDSGLFQLRVSGHLTENDYRVYHRSGLLANDPYAFSPTIGALDEYLFASGTHYDIYRKLGANPKVHQGVKGVSFAVWAPNARSVALVCDANHWDGRMHPMRSLGGSGIWELFVPGLDVGEKYKFEVRTQAGDLLVKTDPYAKQMELRPKTAAIVADTDSYTWGDQAWLDARRQEWDHAKPINVYEVHLGSWRQAHGEFLSYADLAKQLAAYCREMGFTHVELLPVMEHPLDESWGYQVTGFYAPTSRFGSLAEFQAFVDHLHQEGIGVIVDWVPAHFPTDQHSLAQFDGTALYEHADPKQGFHPHWGTLIFNYGRKEVTNFLVANALYWLREMHVDGLRVDAVASMLYLDYGRDDGEWVPNHHGGKENLEAIEFLKHLNSTVHDEFPGALTIAEESTAFPGVTTPVAHDGLGFDMKWNMGWMNDTLRYFSRDTIYRSYHQQELTFGLLYAFTERFCMVLSHDEVVHGKGALLGKMPGDDWQKFANLRLLLSYMGCQPGKNLLFMGGEFGQWNEWNCKQSIDWHLLEYPCHKGVQNMVKVLNHLVLQHRALWEQDFDHTGFEWVDFNDADNAVVSYKRKSTEGDLLCIHNFTPQCHGEYHLHMPGLAAATELFNSDRNEFGGSGKTNPHPHISEDGLTLQIAPLATQILDLRYT